MSIISSARITIPRGVRKPTMSVISSAMLVNPDGDILVNLRDDDPRIIFPNQWSLIGGHVEDGESPEEGLVREVEEEIGYQLSDYHPLATFFDGADVRHLYLVPIDVPIDDLVLGEGQAIRYMDPAPRAGRTGSLRHRPAVHRGLPAPPRVPGLRPRAGVIRIHLFALRRPGAGRTTQHRLQHTIALAADLPSFLPPYAFLNPHDLTM